MDLMIEFRALFIKGKRLGRVGCRNRRCGGDVAVFERRAVLAEVWSSGVARIRPFPRILGYLFAADSVIWERAT
jgi:hypothetical protein